MPDNLLVKFQKLPDELKARASDTDAMRSLDSLETQYGVNLAELVMRVLVQEVEPAKLDEVLIQQYAVPAPKAKELGKHMLDDLFFKYRLLDLPGVKDPVLTAPAPALQAQAGASPYLVHPDDAKDLAPHTQALQQAPVQVVDTNPVNVAKRLVAMEHLELDDILLKRFQRVVESRLVDVRDKSEVRDILLRSTKIGGMGFDEARADRIIGELANVVEALHRQPRPPAASLQAMPGGPKPVIKPLPPPARDASQRVAGGPPPPVVKPTAAPLPSPPPEGGRVKEGNPPLPSGEDALSESRLSGTSRKAGEGNQPARSTVVATQQITKPASQPSAVPRPVVAPPPWLKPSGTPVSRPAPPPQPRPVVPVIPRPQPVAPPTYREVITDVRAPSRVMGPIEVLGSLKIDDFRRLGGTPQACTLKIAEEFEVLGQDSFAQRAEGISAFRQSPAFKSYLMLGQLAMERKEEVREVVELMKAQGKQSLNEAEFEAIGALMRQFRF
ncbi:MAG: hypothetical protein Q8O51_02815 [bacterium]|nr:hypothetical protein [bacterium]